MHSEFKVRQPEWPEGELLDLYKLVFCLPTHRFVSYPYCALHCRDWPMQTVPPRLACYWLQLDWPLGEGNGTPLHYSCLKIPMDGGAWWAAVHGVAKSQTRLSDFPFTFHFHALEKEMATHSSVLAWRIPGMGKPGGLPSMGSHRVRHDWSDLAAAAASLAKVAVS